MDKMDWVSSETKMTSRLTRASFSDPLLSCSLTLEQQKDGEEEEEEEVEE